MSPLISVSKTSNFKHLPGQKRIFELAALEELQADVCVFEEEARKDFQWQMKSAVLLTHQLKWFFLLKAKLSGFYQRDDWYQETKYCEKNKECP